MLLNPFDGPRLKINRARSHIQDITSAQQAYFANHPIIHAVEPTATGGTAYKLKATAPAPIELAVVVSDAVGGLRSSLDLAVCEAARVSGATDLRNTYFHFASSRDEWEKSVKGRTRAAPEPVRDLMRSLEPWASGNDLLYALSRVAAVDKHQLLTPIGVQSGGLSIDRLTSSGSSHLQFLGDNWDTAKGECVYALLGPGSSPLVVEGVSIHMFLAFGDVDIIPHQPVVPILNQLASQCEQIVALLERLGA